LSTEAEDKDGHNIAMEAKTNILNWVRRALERRLDLEMNEQT